MRLSDSVVVLVLGFVACAPSTPAPAEPVRSPTQASAEQLPALSAPALVSASAAPPSAAAVTVASAPTPVSSAAASASAVPTPSGEPPTSNVVVTNIGMHIGGGPNDAVTKEPIKLSVEPHFGAFRNCFALAQGSKGGDFGVDLRIEKEGGKAKVGAPRTAIKGEPFKECVVKVFAGIEFRKPRGGATVVSYSLRFAPATAP